MSLSYRAVVFDLDGTLVDSLADLTEATNRTLDSFQLPRVSMETVRQRIGHGARALLERSVGPDIDPDVALLRFFEAYRPIVAEQTRPFEGIPSILKDIGALGALRGVATNKPAAFVGPILSALDLDGDIDGWASGDEAARKPSPASIQLALARAGAADLHPSLVVYVGDMAVDVATARAFGARSIGVLWGLDPDGLAAAGPDVLVQTAEELRHTLDL